MIEEALNVELIPIKDAAPPKNQQDFTAVRISDELCSVFIPYMGLASQILGADCYVADISVDGTVIFKLILMAKGDNTNIITTKWSKCGYELASWLENQLLSGMYDTKEADELALEYIITLVQGLTKEQFKKGT